MAEKSSERKSARDEEVINKLTTVLRNIVVGEVPRKTVADHIMDATGVAKATAHRKIDLLLDAGVLIEGRGHTMRLSAMDEPLDE